MANSIFTPQWDSVYIYSMLINVSLGFCNALTAHKSPGWWHHQANFWRLLSMDIIGDKGFWGLEVGAKTRMVCGSAAGGNLPTAEMNCFNLLCSRTKQTATVSFLSTNHYWKAQLSTGEPFHPGHKRNCFWSSPHQQCRGEFSRNVYPLWRSRRACSFHNWTILFLR